MHADDGTRLRIRRTADARRLRILLAIPAGLLVLGATALILWLCQEPYAARKLLADGSGFTLKAVTFGSTYPHPYQARWQHALYSVNPALPGAAETGGDVSSRLGVVWLNIQGPAAAGRYGNLSAVIEDRHGCEFDTAACDLVEPWHAPSFACFPRREPRMIVAVKNDAGGRLCDFGVHSPSGEYPVWRPEPFPVRKADGKFAADLLRLSRWQAPDVTGRARGWISGAFRVRHGGVETSEWEPARISVADATGNTREEHIPAYRSGQVGFPGLCRREAAWKLRVEFAPRLPLKVEPDVTWTVPASLHVVPGLPASPPVPAAANGPASGIALPSAGSIDGRVGGRRLLWHGAELTAMRVSGRVGATGSWDCSVRLQVAPRTSALRVTLVSVRDLEGRLIHQHDRVARWDRRRSELSDLTDRDVGRSRARFRVPAGTHRVLLTFAIHRIYRLEFLVDPS